MPKFSVLEEEKLIDLVEQRELLYNSMHPDYNNRPLRLEAWKEISKQMDFGKNDFECLKKWSSMKDYYVRTQKKDSIRFTNSIKQRIERLSFLNGTYIVPTKLSSTLRKSSEIILIKSGSDLPPFNSLRSDTETQSPSHSPIIEISETDFKSSASSEISNDNQSEENTALPAPSTIKRSRESLTSPTMLEDLYKSQDQQHNGKMDFLSNLFKYSSNTPTPDHIDLFLQSIGHTIRTFPEVDISEVKIEILKVITERQRMLQQSKQICINGYSVNTKREP